jgi:hypothetical protein
MWDNIIRLTTRARRKGKRKYIQYPSNSAAWKDCSKTFWRHLALKNLLEGAVSHPNIKTRTGYIDQIMKLPPETQRYLMALIKNKKSQIEENRMKRAANLDVNTPSRESSTSNSIRSNRSSAPSRNTSFATLVSLTNNIMRGPLTSKDSNASSTWTTPHNSSFSPGQTPMHPVLVEKYETKMEELKDQNQNLLKELEESRQKEEETSRKLIDSEAKFRGEIIKIESSSRQRVNELKELYNLKLVVLENDVHRINMVCKNADQREVKMTDIQEELKNLMETKALLDDTTDRLQHYKERADQLQRIKESLREEEEAHIRSVGENIRLQKELKTLQSMKNHFEDYKSRVSKAEIQLLDCQDDLMDKKQKINELREAKSFLEKTIRMQQNEMHALHHQIQQEEQDTLNFGESISGLNPKIKMESQRIQNKIQKIKQGRQNSVSGNIPSPSVALSRLENMEAVQLHLQQLREQLECEEEEEQEQYFEVCDEENEQKEVNELIPIETQAVLGKTPSPAVVLQGQENEDGLQRHLEEEEEQEDCDNDNEVNGMNDLTERQFVLLLRKNILNVKEETSKPVASSLIDEDLKKILQLHDQELNKLRKENAKLKSSTQKTFKLKNEIVASNRLCERYKEQFLTTKIHLERTQLDLQEVMIEFYQSVEHFGMAAQHDEVSNSKPKRRNSI